VTDGARIEVRGLTSLVRELKGPAFKRINYELRQEARNIAETVRPHIALMVALSPAPQSQALAKTVRTKSDRVPVVIIGKTNPRFKSGFRRKSEAAASTKARRGSLAHGVVFGPKGGKRDTRVDENYYAPQRRDDTGGAIMRSVRHGSIFEIAAEQYVAAYLEILTHHGFVTDGSRQVRWRGGS
jgi:hypothetical protein